MKTKLIVSLVSSIVALHAFPAAAELIHRYSFTADVSDSIGSAHGMPAQLHEDGSPIGNPVVFQDGQAMLDGTAGYIDLPNGLVSGLSDMTIEAWVTWHGGGDWARILDFGTSNLGEDVDGSLRPTQGFRYLVWTPQAGDSGRMMFSITDQSNAPGEERPRLHDTLPFEIATEVHVAVTYGPSGARLFRNGQEVAAGLAEIPLHAIEDVNVWLGRANWPDPLFVGSFNEVRIHNSLRTSQELRTSTLAGPDTVSYNPGTATALSITLTNEMAVGSHQTVQAEATFSLLGTVNLTGADMTVTSSNPDVVSIGQLNRLNAVGLGSAIITATLGSLTDTGTVTVAEAPTTVAYWRFEEGVLGSNVSASTTGGDPAFDSTVLDSSGNGNHLRTWADFSAPLYVSDTPFGTVPQTGDANTLALSFTPNRDLYTAGKPINTYGFNEWTVEATFRPNSVSLYQVIVAKDGKTTAEPFPPLFLKILAHNQHLELGMVDGSGTVRLIPSSAPLQVGQWYSVAATASTDELALWIKGPADVDYVLQGSMPINGAFHTVQDIAWVVGRGMWNNAIVDWFDGLIDEVRISNVALSPSQFLGVQSSAPQPALSITRSNGQVTIAWPTSAAGFGLESSATLGSGASWSPVTETPTEVGNEYHVTVSPTGPAMFYRLKQ
jgi:hypothetical protein